jgi:GntR family transcriptional regulator
LRIGATLPPELELCRTLGASRFTIRQALKGLTELGLIERRRGAGSVVVARAPKVVFECPLSSVSELWTCAKATRVVIRRTALVPSKLKSPYLKGIALSERWMQADAERWTADGKDIICWMALYLPARFAAVVAEFEAKNDPLYSFVEAHIGEKLVEITQEISACRMPEEAAKRLNRMKGLPAVRITRSYFDARSAPLLVATSIYPGDGISLNVYLKRKLNGR